MLRIERETDHYSLCVWFGESANSLLLGICAPDSKIHLGVERGIFLPLEIHIGNMSSLRIA